MTGKILQHRIHGSVRIGLAKSSFKKIQVITGKIQYFHALELTGVIADVLFVLFLSAIHGNSPSYAGGPVRLWADFEQSGNFHCGM